MEYNFMMQIYTYLIIEISLVLFCAGIKIGWLLFDLYYWINLFFRTIKNSMPDNKVAKDKMIINKFNVPTFCKNRTIKMNSKFTDTKIPVACM